MLWVATINGLHYSFNAEGDWRYISLESLGLSVRNPITKIGDNNKAVSYTHLTLPTIYSV